MKKVASLLVLTTLSACGITAGQQAGSQVAATPPTDPAAKSSALDSEVVLRELPMTTSAHSVQALLFSALRSHASRAPGRGIRAAHGLVVAQDDQGRILCRSESPGRLAVQAYGCQLHLASPNLPYKMDADSLQALLYESLHAHALQTGTDLIKVGPGSVTLEDEATQLVCKAGTRGMIMVQQYTCQFSFKS